MRTFVSWALARRYWLILLAVGFAQVFPVVTAAIVVLDARRNGPAAAGALAAIALAGIVLLALVTGSNLGMAVTVGVLALGAGLVMGWLLAWARNLNLAFQAAVLGGLVGTLLITLIGPDPGTIVGPLIDEFVSILQAGNATDQQISLVRSWDPALLVGFVYAAVFAQLIGALMLGYWWFALVTENVSFGAEFRVLRLGRIVGIVLMLIVTIGLVWTADAIQNLAPLAVFGFLFQGLAVMHAWAYAKKWHPIVVGLVYISLVTPLSGVTILGLSGAGLLDNFFALRAPLKRQA